MAKISIIIPAYNVEEYIGQCIESVLNQSLQDIEVICLNDGSKDNTLNIIKQYAEKDNRIVVISHENSGVSYTRNAGIKIATGEYIMFLDGDDYLTDSVLEKIYNRAIRDDLDFLMGSADTFVDGEYKDEDKINKFIDMYRIKGEYGEKVYSGPEAMALLRQNKDYYASSSVKLVKSKFIKDNQLFFKDKMIHEDELYSIKVFLLAQKVGITKDSYFMRRMRFDSIMTKVTKKENTFGYLITIMEAIEFLIEKNNEAYYKAEIANILKGILAAIVRTYLELTLEEREEFHNAMTDKQRFFFEIFIQKQQEQTNQIVKLKDNAQKASHVKASLEQMLDSARKERDKLQIKNDELKEKNKKLKEDKQTLKEKRDSLKEDKAKLKEKIGKLKEDKSDLKVKNEKLKGSMDYRIGKAVLKAPRKVKNLFKKN